jgi:hypothetical protein
LAADSTTTRLCFATRLGTFTFCSTEAPVGLDQDYTLPTVAP